MKQNASLVSYICLVTHSYNKLSFNNTQAATCSSRQISKLSMYALLTKVRKDIGTCSIEIQVRSPQISDPVFERLFDINVIQKHSDMFSCCFKILVVIISLICPKYIHILKHVLR